MKHRIGGNSLGRKPSHRKAMERNLAGALLKHGSIITTVARAKAIRPYVEKLITVGKRGNLADKRHLMKKLYVKDEMRLVCDVYGPRFANRAGGYTRITRLGNRRVGDNAELAQIEFLPD